MAAFAIRGAKKKLLVWASSPEFCVISTNADHQSHVRSKTTPMPLAKKDSCSPIFWYLHCGAEIIELQEDPHNLSNPELQNSSVSVITSQMLKKRRTSSPFSHFQPACSEKNPFHNLLTSCVPQEVHFLNKSHESLISQVWSFNLIFYDDSP